MRRIIKWLAWFFLVLGGMILIYTWIRFKDRHPGYQVDFQFHGESGSFSAGFGKAAINPDLPDQWVDKNEDARYRPEDGDYFIDGNQNGEFDAIWIAGFQNQRAAQGIHDTLWARTIVLEQSGFRLVLCVLDAIGLGSDEIITIRKSIPENWNIDYFMVVSTHTHQGPDLLGMWGNGDYHRGVHPKYVELVTGQCLKSVQEAIHNLEPAAMRYAEDVQIAATLVEDTRKPQVMDPGLRVMHFTDVEGKKSLGTLLGWANHPETLWNKNTLLSSDFPHYFREYVENGIYFGDSLLVDGLGGISLFLNGAIGGLMTTSPRFPILNLAGDSTYLEPGYAKARAQGELLAFFALSLMQTDTLIQRDLPLSAIARSVPLKMDNPLFRLGNWLGILNRGMNGWFTLRSEIAYWQLGTVGFLHVPGEIYPEIVNGGVETPEGRDFDITAQEVPPLREILPVSSSYLVGLSNDMIGYILPKSEWDEKPPFMYHEHDAPYGEINSLGPDTGPALHRAMVDMLLSFREQK